MRISRLPDLTLNVAFPLLLGSSFYFLDARTFPALLRSHAADACWAYALASLLLIIWERRLPWRWLAGAFLLALAYEGTQAAGWLAGTADVWDVAVYTGSMLLAIAANIIFINKSNIPKPQT